MYLFFSWKLRLWEEEDKNSWKIQQTSFKEEKLSFFFWFFARDAIEMKEKPVMWKSLCADHFPVEEKFKVSLDSSKISGFWLK